MAVGPVLAQAPAPAPAPYDVATVEAARRDAMRMDLQFRLRDADAAFARGDYTTAARFYEDALSLAKQIGGAVEGPYKLALDGMIASRMRLAEQAQRRADFAEADAQLARILREDPRYEPAIALRAENTRMRIKEEGRRPDEATIAMIPGIQSNFVYAATLVQNGKLLYESGRLDEAQLQLDQARKLDPSNRAAYYYLDLIREQKHKQEMSRREVWSKEKLLEIDRAWADPVRRGDLSLPNPMARTNLIHTSSGRQAIYSKLQRIRLDQVKYDGLPLSEVVRQLTEEARRRDPERRGINIIVSGFADPAPTPPPTIDPATGLPVAAAVPIEPAADLGTTTIRIDPPLVDVTLQDALDAIRMVADRPIKYSVEDYAIVFSSKGPEAVPLHTRTFHVDPNTFYQGLQGVTTYSFGTTTSGQGGGGGGFGGGGGGGRGGGGGGGFGGGGGGAGGGQGQQGNFITGSEYVGVTMAGGQNRQFGGGGVQQQQTTGSSLPQQQGGIRSITQESPQQLVITYVVEFFRAAGVDLAQPGRQVFFNDRRGLLVVHATLQELDIIEQAIQILNMPPPQITIEAKFAEVTQDDTRSLGFDWFLGNTLFSEGRVGVQGGTAPSFPGTPTDANPGPPGLGNNFFPGPSGIPGAGFIPPSATDNVLTSGLRNTAPAVTTISGILTDPQFRVVIRALEQRAGVDLLTAPKVTTLSSRQTQIKVVDVRSIVTDLGIGQTASGGGLGGGLGGVGGGAGVVGGFIQPITEQIELGPVLDVVPYVSADGYTIQMTIIPTIKEFIGYDLETAQLFAAQVQSVSSGTVGGALTTTTPLPQFRLRQVITSAIVWDGQTVVLGGLIAENLTKTKDKVPLLGDIPLLGRLFRSESFSTKKKNLLIFVTPTIIDPAGNRVHSDEELPFAQSTIPPQAPFTPSAQ